MKIGIDIDNVISNFNVYVAQKKKYFLCKERF
jgi:hypothetical protein